MPQFKIGDKVRRNSWSDDVEDGNLVKLGDIGEILSVTECDEYDYLVHFENRGRWYIKAACLESLEPRTKETIEKEVIAKIRYLNEKYTKSRTVPPQVVNAEQRELRESLVCARPEECRITTVTGRIHDSYYIDGNAIRSETTRLRGIDSVYELLYQSGVFDEFLTNDGTERVRR